MSGYLGQAPGQGQIQYFTYTATAGQTTFTGIDDNKYVLNYAVGFCDVFLNGRRLTPTSDYTATNGSTITLQSAASVNDVIFVASASTFDTANWVTNAVNYVYTATAGQTTFTGSDDNANTLSYVNGTILVSVNGINIPQSDYTATNGTSVVLNSGVNLGDIVQIFSLRTMAVVNFLPLSGGTVTGTITVGNSSVNTQITAGNIALNGSTLLIGNSTSNVVLTGTTLTISNTTSNVSISPGPASINAISTNTFTVGNTLYVVSNGNVGLSNTAPTHKLSVNGSTYLGGNVTISGTAFYSNNLLLQGDGSDAYIRPINANSALFLGSNNANKVYIGANGNVGVGTFTPGTKLDVSGSIRGQGLTLTSSAIVSGINQLSIDYLSSTGDSRLIAWGPNTAVGGNLAIFTASSDASQYSEAFRIDKSGHVSFATVKYYNKYVTQEGAPNLGTYKGYLLLAKAYVSGLQDKSYVNGKFTLMRGSSGSGERTDVFEVVSASAYNSETLTVKALSNPGSGFFLRTVKVTYGGVVYHAIETSQSGGQPDVGVFFEGRYSNAGAAPLYTDGSYVSSVTDYGYADVSNGNAINGLYLQNGRLTFPGTQNNSTDPNTLDDYEEGSWAPVMTPGSGSFTTTSVYGKYTKIGRLVFIVASCHIVTVGSAAGSLKIQGLPFTVYSAGAGRPFSGVAREDYSTGNTYQLVPNNGSTLVFISTLTNGDPPLLNNYLYTFSVTYYTD